MNYALIGGNTNWSKILIKILIIKIIILNLHQVDILKKKITL